MNINGNTRKIMYLAGAAVVLLLAWLVADQALPRFSGPAVSTTQDAANAAGEFQVSKAANLALAPLPVDFPAADEGIQRALDLHTEIPARPRVDVLTYTVETGDNLFLIAEQYGLKPETILWGNFDVLRDNPQFLKPEQVLNILPVDGVYYQWAAGDTLEKVSNFFEVDPQTILNYPGNRFDLAEVSLAGATIEEGQWLIIPGGKRELRDWGPPPITRANPAAAAYYGSGYCGEIYQGAIGIGAFLWPTTENWLSGWDYTPPIHNGIDIAGTTGNAIFASDSGVVVFSGWSEYGFGNLIVLDHGNGWQSAYAHLDTVAVGCGQSVAQGSVIGSLGNTGNSTGPHLHYELRHESYGKVNPWDFVSP